MLQQDGERADSRILRRQQRCANLLTDLEAHMRAVADEFDRSR